MACPTCHQKTCVCDPSGCEGPELIVEDPSGSENGASLDPACDDCDRPTDSCCNLFDFQSEGAGKSFVLSLGGLPNADPPTFLTPFPVANPDGSECQAGQCCSILEPREIDGLGTMACMPEAIPPGTFMVFARATLFSLANPAPAPFIAGEINPGAKLSIRYIEDCNDPINPVEIAGCGKPCTCCPPGVAPTVQPPTQGPPSKAVLPLDAAFIPFEVLHCTGFTMVFSPTCRPAFQILAVNGCDPGSPLVNASLFVANIQILMFYLSARDLVNCGPFPLASVLGVTLPNGCGPPPG